MLTRSRYHMFSGCTVVQGDAVVATEARLVVMRRLDGFDGIVVAARWASHPAEGEAFHIRTATGGWADVTGTGQVAGSEGGRTISYFGDELSADLETTCRG